MSIHNAESIVLVFSWNGSYTCAFKHNQVYRTRTITIARLLFWSCQKIVIIPICLFLELSRCLMFSCSANFSLIFKCINLQTNVLIACDQQMHRCKVHTNYNCSMRVHPTFCTFGTDQYDTPFDRGAVLW